MKYLIVGLGKSGRAALELLEATGVARQDIATFDNKDTQADYGDPTQIPSTFSGSSLVLSPGVPLQTPWIQERLKNGSRLESEISLAWRHLQGEKIIGITGSVGKSTTTALLAAGVAAIDPHFFVGANFGTPFCEYALRVLRGGPRAKWIILELSSFQLENPGPLRLDLAVITSLMSNHLERYPNREAYYQTKWDILQICRGQTVMNSLGGDLVGFAKQQKPTMIHWTKPEDPDLQKDRLSENSLIGRHNLENLAVAAKVAHLLNWPVECIDRMKVFKGLEHRLENLGLHQGVLYVNDSKATAMESVLSAVTSCLETMSPSARIYLLLGGRDKNLPWNMLAHLATESRLMPVFFGECGALAKKSSMLSGHVYSKMSDAFLAAKSTAKPGDTVLLSPGGTSLDEFKNFEDRGRVFKELVTQL